uniref:Centrosomal protein of 97 kDa n=1 Tax=Cacopsylla melanoneura TaxID=428564 RepID=A0A8D8SW91_9HEMI
MTSSRVTSACLDLTNQDIKKLPKCLNNPTKVLSLILDRNQLTRLDNVDSYTELKELSAKHNSLSRMLHVMKLQHLVTLDLSNNNIVCIEGLKELRNLRRLILANNNIKTIEHVHTNIHLDLLDLSHNSIQSINNLSSLTRLKTLHLSNNKLSHLRHCNLYLPSSLIVLSLDGNHIGDLAEVSHLMHLTSLEEISLARNPCLTHATFQFDYRPFLLNWITSVRIIDKIPATKMECLKAEWLYSQGRGRKFHVGQHEELLEYLSQQTGSSQLTTCNGGTGGVGEDEKKLRLVLSKAQMYQQQLKQERMYGNDPELMTRSLDPYILQGVTHHTKPEIPSDLALSRSIAGPAVSSFTSVPLPTATTLLPVPESLPSPLITSLPSLPSSTSTSKLSITQEEDFSLSSSGGNKQLRGIHRTVLNRNKLQGQIEAERRGSLDLVLGQPKVERRRSQGHLEGERRRESFDRQDSAASHSNSRDSTDNATGFLMDEHQAAVCIQKFWRGYKARNLDSNVAKVCQTIQTQRINKYVHQLVADMAATREALACEHQLQVLQLQAINALWNKMVTQEPCNVQRCACLSSSIQYEITSLKNVCEELKNQVAEIKSMNHLGLGSGVPRAGCTSSSTAQTDIVAVHTPVGDNPPPSLFHRPCSLPLTETLRTSVINHVGDSS